jgi:Protein of unknown function (DUF3592)
VGRRSSNALSDKSNRQGGSGCLVLFGLVFAGFGSIFVVIFFLIPLLNAIHANGWIEVPCTILDSRVGESHGDKGTTYRVEVRYEYHFRPGDLESDPTAPRYESTRYDFMDGIYSSGRDSKDAEVRRLAAGKVTTCRVDPANPAEAVLIPGFPAGLWFGLITLIFPLVGLALMIGGFVGMRRARLRRDGCLPLSGGGNQLTVTNAHEDTADTNDTAGPVELRPAQGRVGKVIAIGIFAAIWNGIVWTILGVAILPGIRAGGIFEWFPLLFLSLFALIGLFLLGAFFHALLALTNPRLRLTVNRQTIRPGDWLELEWECSGNPSRITSLTIALEGRESATYTRGTDTVTDTHVFARLALATLDDAAAILSGRTRFQIPADAMPTFIVTHNKFEWRLIVRGSIPRWPDISDDYTVTVLPPRSAP